MVNRHSSQYPKTVISLLARAAAYARNYRETPTPENLNSYVRYKREFLVAKAEHHKELAETLLQEASQIDGSDLEHKKA